MANIVLRLSTGSGATTNSDPNAALGGQMATNAEAIITTANTSLNNLFDDVTKAENFNGTTDYRCVYVHNDTATPGDIFASGEVYISGSPYTDVQIGVGTINATAVTVANESGAPSGIVFSAPSSGSALSLGGDLDENDYVALWIKRTANNIAGTGTVTDSIPLSVRGVE